MGLSFEKEGSPKRKQAKEPEKKKDFGFSFYSIDTNPADDVAEVEGEQIPVDDLIKERARRFNSNHGEGMTQEERKALRNKCNSGLLGSVSQFFKKLGGADKKEGAARDS